jgi:hypothetical protein
MTKARTPEASTVAVTGRKYFRLHRQLREAALAGDKVALRRMLMPLALAYYDYAGALAAAGLPPPGEP